MRTRGSGRRGVSDGPRATRHAGREARPTSQEPPVLDIVYVLVVIAAFAVVALVGKGVEKL